MARDYDKIDDCERRGVCYYCDQPILDGQARYSPLHAHWDCHEREVGPPVTDADLRQQFRNVQDAIEDLRKKLR